jgi:hypothetical protein
MGGSEGTGTLSSNVMENSLWSNVVPKLDRMLLADEALPTVASPLSRPDHVSACAPEAKTLDHHFLLLTRWLTARRRRQNTRRKMTAKAPTTPMMAAT